MSFSYIFIVFAFQAIHYPEELVPPLIWLQSEPIADSFFKTKLAEIITLWLVHVPPDEPPQK